MSKRPDNFDAILGIVGFFALLAVWTFVMLWIVGGH